LGATALPRSGAKGALDEIGRLSSQIGWSCGPDAALPRYSHEAERAHQAGNAVTADARLRVKDSPDLADATDRDVGGVDLAELGLEFRISVLDILTGNVRT
jgi:hypothetical protein